MITKLVIRSDYGVRGFSKDDGGWKDVTESLVHTWILNHDGTPEGFEQAYLQAERNYVNEFMQRRGVLVDGDCPLLYGAPVRFHVFEVLKTFDMEQE